MERKNNIRKSNFKQKQKKSHSSIPYRMIAAGVGIVMLLGAGIGAGIYFLPNGNGNSKKSGLVAEGVDYILSLENKSIEDIEKMMSQERKQAAIAEMESEDFNVWAHFGNIVMMGDSRTKEYAHSEFVEERRVMAEDGDTILNIPYYLDELVDLNPDYIILEYGVNDMENYDVWPTVDVYLQEMDKKIASIREVVPNATIFIQSILPCIDPELSRLACRREIPAWNQAIEAYCDEKGIPFIDVTDLAETYEDYYEPDGMHFIASFYPFWAKRLIAEVVTYEN